MKPILFLPVPRHPTQSLPTNHHQTSDISPKIIHPRSIERIPSKYPSPKGHLAIAGREPDYKYKTWLSRLSGDKDSRQGHEDVFIFFILSSGVEDRRYLSESESVSISCYSVSHFLRVFFFLWNTRDGCLLLWMGIFCA